MCGKGSNLIPSVLLATRHSAVDTAFVMVDDNSPTHIQFAWLTPNGLGGDDARAPVRQADISLRSCGRNPHLSGSGGSAIAPAEQRDVRPSRGRVSNRRGAHFVIHAKAWRACCAEICLRRLRLATRLANSARRISGAMSRTSPDAYCSNNSRAGARPGSGTRDPRQFQGTRLITAIAIRRLSLVQRDPGLDFRRQIRLALLRGEALGAIAGFNG